MNGGEGKEDVMSNRDPEKVDKLITTALVIYKKLSNQFLTGKETITLGDVENLRITLLNVLDKRLPETQEPTP